MGSCVSKEHANQVSSPARLNERQSLDHISEMYKKAFGKLSASLPNDIDFFVPDTGPLNAEAWKARLVTSNSTQQVKLPYSGVIVRYAYVSQRGYYPDAMMKANQDAFVVRKDVAGEPDTMFFGVFDGHGSCGTDCAQFARDKVLLNMMADQEYFDNPAVALDNAMRKTNMQLHASQVDDSLSGTTAVAVLLKGKKLVVANVGDSRAVLAERTEGGLTAIDLTQDQTPYRKDELARVKSQGARVMTLEQLDGLVDPDIQDWGMEEEDNGDPPRLWHPEGSYPGTAFTRSIGDSVAEEIGVIGLPEISTAILNGSHAFLVIATDGVWEFLGSQMVVDLVAKHKDPQDACLAVVVESYKAWLATEARTDDITVIVVEFELGEGLTISKTPSANSLPDSRSNSVRGGAQPGMRRLASQKSLRKGLARGSLAMLDSPGTMRGEPVSTIKSMPKANGSGVDAEEYMMSAGMKTEEEVSYLQGIFRSHPQFMRLDPRAIAAVIDVCSLRFTTEGEVLIEQGQPGNYFYVVKEGTFALKVREKNDAGVEDLQTVHRYAPASGTDSCFGEISLVSGAKPYGGNIIARTAGQLWQLDRRAYKHIVASYGSKSATAEF